MKTLIKVTSDSNQCSIKKGESGYIDGYCRGGDDIPYAIVITTGKKIDMVPIHCLKIL